MTRGQRAAQQPKFGAWRLTGIVAIGSTLFAAYERNALHMLSDGTWRPSTETKSLSLNESMFAAAVPLGDYQAMQVAFCSLSNRLCELAKQHQKPPENEP